MKKALLILVILFGIIIMSGCKEEEPTPVEETNYNLCKGAGYQYDPLSITDYELVWFDEFNLDGEIDKTKWGYDLGGSGLGNN